jgi:DNA-binding Lrp family transcriptional regulator
MPSPRLKGEPRRLDLEIIAHLQDDARKPFTAIADELGLPESTVRKRVTRLQQEGILLFTAFADPLRLGFQYWSLIQIKVDLACLEATSAKLASRPEIFFVGITAGDYNLFVAGIFRSNADLLAFLIAHLPGMPGFQTSASSNVLKVVKRRGPLLGDRSRLHARSRPDRVPLAVDGVGAPQIDLLDTRIIALLQADGRRSYAQVAEALAVAETTVHKRLRRLRDLGILHFEAFADPLRLGFQHWTLFNLSVAPKRIADVASELAEFPELFFVGITAGRADVFVTGVFRSNDELLRFLSEAIGRNPAVTGVSITNVLKLVKRQLVYPLSAGLAEPESQEIS